MRTLTNRDINILVTAAAAHGVAISLTTPKGKWISGPITNATAADCGRMLLATYDRLLDKALAFRDPDTAEIHQDTIRPNLAALRSSYHYEPTTAPAAAIATAIAIIQAAAYDAPFFDGTMTALFLDRITTAISQVRVPA